MEISKKQLSKIFKTTEKEFKRQPESLAEQFVESYYEFPNLQNAKQHSCHYSTNQLNKALSKLDLTIEQKIFISETFYKFICNNFSQNNQYLLRQLKKYPNMNEKVVGSITQILENTFSPLNKSYSEYLLKQLNEH